MAADNADEADFRGFFKQMPMLFPQKSVLIRRISIIRGELKRPASTKSRQIGDEFITGDTSHGSPIPMKMRTQMHADATQIFADIRHAERPKGAKHLASEASAMRWFLRFARFLGRFAPSE